MYDEDNRLLRASVDSVVNSFAYDYRSRRYFRATPTETNLCVFDGGLSVQEYNATQSLEPNAQSLSVEFIRGQGMGGGVGGMVYSITTNGIKASHANQRGDVIARSGGSGSLTSFSRYEAYGTRPYEWGTDTDRQKANTKEEEKALGLLNEGMRFRDLDAGTWLTRDPIGFKDGPNVYCYVHCNPITKVDPLGLELRVAMSPGDTLADYIRNCETFIKAVDYLEKSDTARTLLNDLAGWDEIVTITFNNKDDDKYRAKNNNVNWDPDSGLKVGNNGDVQSGALGLAHELGHADQDKSGGLSQSATTAAIEVENLRKTETPIANELGEPTRANYNDVKGVVTMPNSTSFINNSSAAAKEAAEKAAKKAEQEAKEKAKEEAEKATAEAAAKAEAAAVAANNDRR